MESRSASTGIPSLDEVLEGLRLGDNVVWQVDRLEDYEDFVGPFAENAIGERRPTVYIRFASHPPLLTSRAGLEIVEVDPETGFDVFSREVHRIIDLRGKGVFYVFDNLSALVEDWATDELLANFFQLTCPFLFEMDTVTYFALTRGAHAGSAVARIRDTTQLLIDTYRSAERRVLHPIKVWDRYTQTMFLPHVLSDGQWVPVFQSGEATAVSLMTRSPLEDVVSPMAPWNAVYNRLRLYYHRDREVIEADPEVKSLKGALRRMILGSHPEFDWIADRYMSLDDLLDIRNRIVGSGRIGGKAAGMLLARGILRAAEGADGGAFSDALEPHDSFYIGSDVFFTYLVNNGLFQLRLEASREDGHCSVDFEEIQRRFLAGRFPRGIVEQFRNMLAYFGQAPMIVRSSSLLEDSFGNAFAGKYLSEFCPNQGDLEDRLDAFTRAIRLVYASALNPDALSYRRKRGLGETDEQMAILVQRVAGSRHGRYFFPGIAGVAFSRNLHAWCDRIDPDQGLLRLVFGLGTRAVDRVGGDYPRMVALSQPHLRPEVGSQVARYSQRFVDLLDLEKNAFESVPVSDLLENVEYPDLHLYVSVFTDGGVTDPASRLVKASARELIPTFNNLLKQTDLVTRLRDMLSELERVYERPVDTEFTASMGQEGKVRLNLLQCRPLFLPGHVETVSLPEDLPRQHVLFRARGVMSGGVVGGIRHVVYVDPGGYGALEDPLRKKQVGRVVGRINRHPAVLESPVVLMGPGRWGSSHIDLGVHVGYADIDHAAVLVEVAREEAGHVPEVSYGTHFFQDLVEDGVIYIPLYPDEPEEEFQEDFFTKSPNILGSLLPDAADYADVIRVIDVPATTGGLFARAVADPTCRKAILYLCEAP